MKDLKFERENRAAIALSLSLSGGQGKTLSAYILGLKASLNSPVLLIDADPQKNLSDFLGLDIHASSPTLLEVIQEQVSVEDAIYPVAGRDNLFLLPSDRALASAQQYLASKPNCSRVLRRRLEPVLEDFSLILIDAPPQKSHLVLTAIGASDLVIIPSEATAKGVGSLIETWSLLDDCAADDAFTGQIIGILPFRARMVGHHFTSESREALEAFHVEALARSQPGLILPPILESTIYQRAINNGKLPSELDPDKSSLEHPFDLLLQRISSRAIPAIAL